MALSEINALPVRNLLNRNGVVFLWATAPSLPQALAAMECWGVTYKTHFVWRKVTRTGKIRMGCGFWARTMHELILLGTVGKPRKFTLPSCFDGLAREHSRKPDEFYSMIVERTPGWRRADLFARERRLGWDVWGDQVDRFTACDAVSTFGAPERLAGHCPRSTMVGGDDQTDAAERNERAAYARRRTHYGYDD